MSKFFCHATSIIDEGVTIGDDTKIWHWTHISKGAKIGERCIFGQNVFVGESVVIGKGVKVQNNVSIYKNVVIEDYVFCGPSMVFTNVLNPRANVERKDEFKQTLVKKGATLGANCTVVCGVEIGEYSLIGAGAVVTKNVKPHALVVGVPAKQVGWVSHDGEILKEDMICPRSQQKYELHNGNLILKGIKDEAAANK